MSSQTYTPLAGFGNWSTLYFSKGSLSSTFVDLRSAW
jgi:hypothetical protein